MDWYLENTKAYIFHPLHHLLNPLVWGETPCYHDLSYPSITILVHFQTLTIPPQSHRTSSLVKSIPTSVASKHEKDWNYLIVTTEEPTIGCFFASTKELVGGTKYKSLFLHKIQQLSP